MSVPEYLPAWQDPHGHFCANHPEEEAVACAQYEGGWSFRCEQCDELDREINGF